MQTTSAWAFSHSYCHTVIALRHPTYHRALRPATALLWQYSTSSFSGHAVTAMSVSVQQVLNVALALPRALSAVAWESWPW